MTLIILFWTSLFLIAYTYLFYPILLLFLRLGREKKLQHIVITEEPTVTVIIAVYNEENVLSRKLGNLREIDYPISRLRFLIGSDGSNDRTNDILKNFVLPNLTVHYFTDRRGKSAVLNDLVAQCDSEIIVFSDADTIFIPQTVRNLVQHFHYPSIGAVCGELLQGSIDSSVAGFGENFYRVYDNMIRQFESDIKTTLGTTGAVYAIRRNLYEILPSQKLVADDFIIPIQILKKGYMVKYESKAIGIELTHNSVTNEFDRKSRLGASNFQGIPQFSSLLNPIHGFVSLALWSHKIIRWCVPFLLLLLLFASALLFSNAGFYYLFFKGEIFFYSLALLGFLFEQLKMKISIFGLPYYFVAMNAALFVGFIKFLRRSQRTTWEVIR